MDFVAVVDQAIALLRQRGRLTYRTLQLQFQLDDEHLQALTDELIEGQRLAIDEVGRVLVWTGAPGATAPTVAAPAGTPSPARSRTRRPISRRKFSPCAVCWKASASRSRCCLPI